MATQLQTYKDKLFWFIVPLIITFFTWLVISISSINANISSIQTDNLKTNETLDKTWTMVQDHYNNTDIRGEKMWAMIQENNEILSKKADDGENKKDHMQLKNQLEIITRKVDRIYLMNSYSSNKVGLVYTPIKIDTHIRSFNEPSYQLKETYVKQ